MNETPDTTDSGTPTNVVPLNPIKRRILGVLIEKARTTPDAYPLSLNGLINGANQKSNRFPLMQLTAEQVEDEIAIMREQGSVAEVHGGGRVPKYRHYATDYLGVKGQEAGVMAELLLRGAQTAGELRTRASRFGAIADLASLNEILKGLMERGLVISLTSGGRGQLFTHNLYEPEELQRVKSHALADDGSSDRSSSSAGSRTSQAGEIQALKAEVQSLRSLVEALGQRVSQLEG